MNTAPKFSGIVKFRVEGQKALPPFQQEINRRFIAMDGEMPNALRYQCRIATDARKAFESVPLADGETLTLHHRVMPQFGWENDRGRAFLTATMVYSGDGKTYRVKWIGSKVPGKMLDVAVRHDEGKFVAATTIMLDLADAEVSAVRARVRDRAKSREHEQAYERRHQEATGENRNATRRKYSCGRATRAKIDAANAA